MCQTEENEGLETFAGHIAKCSQCASAFESDKMPDTDPESYCPEGRRTWDLA